MIAALLNFYDEDPDLLSRSVEAIFDAGVDGIVAVDGAYIAYPHGGKIRSNRACYDAIGDVVDKRKKWLVFHQPNHSWKGNEVGKRQYMLREAQLRLQTSDWMLIFDSDHFWETDRDLHELLEPCPTEMNFARVSFAEVFEPDGTPIYSPARPLMRARADLRMGSNHYTYMLDDEVSTFLERGQEAPLKPAFDLRSSVHVIHGVQDRDPARRAKQTAFYERRETEGLEK